MRCLKVRLCFHFAKLAAPGLRALCSGSTPCGLSSLDLATLIAVDTRDNVVGSINTKDAHSWAQIKRGASLHRAFSVFLFNSNGDMLIQKRAAKKLLFPGVWSNTCCSHPLYNAEEMDDKPPFIGIKRAAQRKMSQEFNIAPLPLRSFHCVSRILYKAQYTEDLGEHELDYIIFTQSDLVPLPNLDEVEMTQYVSPVQLKSLLELSQRNEKLISFSPWFRLIAEKLLPSWWERLGDMSALKDMESIHELT
ncbi:isopentenyl-diphosphate delta-isomerase [Trichuris suis]|nr:isopentenyl-diphosphate delta-isomerase [Trichuris suis]